MGPALQSEPLSARSGGLEKVLDSAGDGNGGRT
jgi:hypothetical protein